MKKPDKFLTKQAMLDWQYFQILSDLQEIQRHSSDETCPCVLSDDLGENCLAKHSLGLSGIAAETAVMETDKKNASLLWELAADAKDRHMKIRGFLCHQENAPEFTEWSRQWRKKIEPIYYHKSCKVNLKDDAVLGDTPATMEVKAPNTIDDLVASLFDKPKVKVEPQKQPDGIDKIVAQLFESKAKLKDSKSSNSKQSLIERLLEYDIRLDPISTIGSQEKIMLDKAKHYAKQSVEELEKQYRNSIIQIYNQNKQIQRISYQALGKTIPKWLQKAGLEGTALLDKKAMVQSEPVQGEVSSVDIPLMCGSQPVDPVIAKAIANAEEI